MDDYYEIYKRDGYVEIPNVFGFPIIDDLQHTFDLAIEHIQSGIGAGKFETCQNLTPNFYDANRLVTSTIYDVGGDKVVVDICGLTEFAYGMSGGLLEDQMFLYPPQVEGIVKEELKTYYNAEVGAIHKPANQEIVGELGWHRDIATLFEDEALDLSLPEWELSMFIPLVDLTPENGSLEFILGSHKASREECKELPRKVALGKAGDVFLFSGKTVHRGIKNTTDEERPVVYVTYRKKWVKDLEIYV